MTTLRAVAESGTAYDDPSEAVLSKLLDDIECGDEQFAIIERVASPETYVQVVKNESGGWLIERRDGGPDAHFAVEVASIDEAHGVLTSWASGTPQAPAPEWTKLEF